MGYRMSGKCLAPIDWHSACMCSDLAINPGKARIQHECGFDNFNWIKKENCAEDLVNAKLLVFSR